MMPSSRERDAAGRLFHELRRELVDLVGNTATITEETIPGYPIRTLTVTPHRDGACPLSIVAEQFLVIGVGSPGARWELGGTSEDGELARGIVEAVVAGRVSERRAPLRSRVTVELGDGDRRDSTTREGCVSLLIPVPGWTRWGRVTRYAPYRG